MLIFQGSASIAIIFLCFFLFQAPSLCTTTFFESANIHVSTGSFKRGKYWVLLTALFFHDGFSHLLNNMLLFWAYSTVLEYIIGSYSLIGYYILCGITGWGGNHFFRNILACLY